MAHRAGLPCGGGTTLATRSKPCIMALMQLVMSISDVTDSSGESFVARGGPMGQGTLFAIGGCVLREGATGAAAGALLHVTAAEVLLVKATAVEGAAMALTFAVSASRCEAT